MIDNCMEKIRDLNTRMIISKMLLDRFFKPYYNNPISFYPLILDNSSSYVISQNSIEQTGEEKIQKSEIEKNNSSKKLFVSINLKNDTAIKELKPTMKPNTVRGPKLTLRSDCIRKRIKTHANNYILNKLNLMLSKQQNDMFLFKLPMQIITDMRISTNKILNTMKIREIFSTYVPGQEDDKRVHHNKKVIEKISSNELIEFIEKTFGEVFNEYLLSEQYEKDCNILEIKEGFKYVRIFQENCNSYLEYYSNSIGSR